jgi:hypothetical protein
LAGSWVAIRDDDILPSTESPQELVELAASGLPPQ